MSRATKRAQERRNRTPDEEVTDKTVFAQVAGFRTSVGFRTSEKGRIPDVRKRLDVRRRKQPSAKEMSEVRKFSDVRKGGRLESRFEPETRFGRKMATLEAKLEGKEEKLGLGNAKGSRSTC